MIFCFIYVSALTPIHLRKAKLMFFYTRYPTSPVLKNFFPDVRFNKLLKDLSKRLNFDVIYANLQIQHLHTDGLHPSISSGRVLIENAIKNYLNKLS